MLAKLLKYEWKSTARTFFPLYLSLAALTLITCIAIYGHSVIDYKETLLVNIISTLLTISWFAMVIGLSIITFLITIQRFNKALLSGEGYLMFTLPVTTDQLILSRLIIGWLWNTLSAVAMLLSTLIILLVAMGDSLTSFLQEVWPQIQYAILQIPPGVLLPFLILFCTSAFTGMLLIYFSLSLGSTRRFAHQRIGYAILFYFVLTTAFSILSVILNILIQFNATSEISGITNYFWAGAILNVFLIAGAYLGTRTILQKHLSLN